MNSVYRNVLAMIVIYLSAGHCKPVKMEVGPSDNLIVSGYKYKIKVMISLCPWDFF